VRSTRGRGGSSLLARISSSVERVCVEAPIYDDFVARVSAKVGALRQGVPGGPGSVDMRAITWSDDLGTKMETGEIPVELMEQAQEYHHQLIDSVAEFDDELTEAYLTDEQSVTAEMIRRAVRAATLANKISPVLLGSAFKNKGVQPLLDAVVDYLPSPVDVPAVKGLDASGAQPRVEP